MAPIKGSIALADCVFPEEIMLCILTRLPVKSILRFRSVCKPWSNFFSTPEFRKMHQVMSLFEIDSDETKPKILDHPRPDIRHKEIVGCCNGLICLIRPHLVLSNIVLWNPAMKLYKYVRVLGNVSFFSSIKTKSLGFGYDAERDDYKVVRIFCFLEKEEDDVGVLLLHKNSVIVNGNPYWVAEVEEDSSMSRVGEFLVCFDVRRMVFKAVPLHNLDSDTEHATLMDWKESLGSLVCTRDYDNMTKPLHVLVFDDGDRIWRKAYTFGPIEVDVGRVLECSVNVKMLCCKDEKLFVFDPETGWVKFYESERPLLVIHSFLYTERLTWITGMESEPEKEENCFWEVICCHSKRNKWFVFDSGNGWVEKIVTQSFDIYGYLKSLSYIEGGERRRSYLMKGDLQVKRKIIFEPSDYSQRLNFKSTLSMVNKQNAFCEGEESKMCFLNI
ncbi:hypothetical protein CASFOL_027848 [Castilleja foliolosa]|uniref:F-box domain-containing protein n=1 Tax=Castilleja foliolosa TaxID=1961234 RepID=A0ABD3CJJ3_9LAMI